MCIVVIAFGVSARYPLMLAANRDERHARPSAPAGWWAEAPSVLGGRDLVAGGSWLALSRRGRLAAVTNIFEVGAAPAPRSRGGLVGDFVSLGEDLDDYSTRVEAAAAQYGPFNLILHAAGRLVSLSNRRERSELEPGLHVFGNNAPGEDWPKLELARRGMEPLLASADPIGALLTLLASGADEAGTRSPREAVFVRGPAFGTRSSTVVLYGADDRVAFTERRFDADAQTLGTTDFQFALERRDTG